MSHNEKIVAVGLLTASELKNFGASLKQVYHIQDDNKFDDLLRRLDEAGGKRKSGLSAFSRRRKSASGKFD